MLPPVIDACRKEKHVGQSTGNAAETVCKHREQEATAECREAWETT